MGHVSTNLGWIYRLEYHTYCNIEENQLKVPRHCEFHISFGVLLVLFDCRTSWDACPFSIAFDWGLFQSIPILHDSRAYSEKF